MLNYYFDIPMSEPWLRKMPAFGPVILHLHRFAIVRNRTIYMMRDPRDIVISHYHKFLPDSATAVQVTAARYCEAPLTHENVRENLPGYIRFLFREIQPPAIPMDRHIRKARSLGLYSVRYEDLLTRGEQTLSGIVEYLEGRPSDPARISRTLDAFRFERQSGRTPGDEHVGAAVMRKGIAGDWKNHFSRESALIFDELAGQLLIETGYESSHDWVDLVM